MARDFTNRRRFLIAGLALLVVADAALALYSWQLGSRGQLDPAALVRQADHLKLIEADIERAKTIQREMPAVQKDCDQFVRMLSPASAGSSASEAGLHEMARSAGVQIQDLDFKQAEDATFGLNLTKVEIAATISGDYRGVVRFVNALQRSPSLYVLRDLQLTGDSQNPAASSVVRVALHLRTYFRSGA